MKVGDMVAIDPRAFGEFDPAPGTFHPKTRHGIILDLYTTVAGYSCATVLCEGQIKYFYQERLHLL